MATILHASAPKSITSYLATLSRAAQQTACTDGKGARMPLNDAILTLIDVARRSHREGGSIFFIGNGGSAAIASHMATDFCKNGLRTRALNDSATLTCMANDYGYPDVFALQLELHARLGDVLFAISSSGQSANILRAAETARRIGCYVATLSGFASENPLRRLGDLNLYVEQSHYGMVELAHLCLCHAIADFCRESR